MATSYTSLLGLALPVTGELSSTWGDTVNDYITQYLDASIAGTQTISGSQTAVTLSKTTNASLSQAASGATGSSQYQIINCTGNPASLLTITVPAASKAYLVLNNTSTNQSVKVVGTGPTTGVTVAAARCALIAWNGSDFELVASTDVAALQGLGTGVATALAVNTGTAGAFVVNGGALGTPSSGTVTNLTGTASININGTVGATTPTTGAFTTLTTSSTVTLNGGTANGVAYLNGSKVLTTGSALTFDGTNFSTSGNVAINTYGSSVTFTSSGGSGSGSIGYTNLYNLTIQNNRGQNPYIDLIYNSGHAFGVNGSEQMRLTSTGLGIGTSSPSSKLDVSGGATTATIRVRQTAANSASEVRFGDDAGTDGGLIIKGGSSYGSYGGANSFMFWNNRSGPVVFGTNDTERARITSGGDLLVGTTSASATSGNAGVIVFASGRTAIQRNVDGSDSVFQAFGNAGAAYIQGNGNLLNTNNSYGSLSDAKLKENVVDATPKLNQLNQVRVVNYNLIGDTQKQIGVIAQELEQVFPSMVEETPDRDVDGNDLGTTTKSVKYSVFVPMLIKAIQEQQAMIQQLQAEVAALKGN